MSNTINYADDSQLLSRADALSHSAQLSAINTLQTAVDSLGIWMRRVKQKLNEEKTQSMVLGTKRSTAACNIDSIQLGSEHISKSDCAVNLGVAMDS